MGDVKRFRKEVVDSIGAGTASPVRAVFSSAVLGSAVPSADGDTFLMGEMVGVDEGLVIQELSRADELVKLQHELEKQVSKLAELGELKWLEELEKLQTEEIQKVKDSIGEMEKKLETEVEAARKAVVTTLELQDKKEWEKIGKWVKLQGALKALGVEKLEEVEKAKEKIEVEIEKLEKIKVEELATAEKVGQEIEKLGELVKEVEELKGKVEKSLVELEKIPLFKKGTLKVVVEEVEKVKKDVTSLGLKGIKAVVKLKDLKSRLEELETIKGLKEGVEKSLGDKEWEKMTVEELNKFRESEEIAQLKALVEVSIGKLEDRKMKEVEGKLKGTELELVKKWLLHKFGAEGKTLEEVKQEWEKEKESLEKLVKKLRDSKQLEAVRGELQKKEIAIKGKLSAVHQLEQEKEKHKALKNTLVELAAIRELKELGLEERLRELAEVKEVRAKPCVLDW
ncbi:hypothetical protein [Anaplasma centrale]|uniref:hypothetical protein n=1 Tax=Anaplasma centrale TaxID=769 RepID=UPI00030FCED9|nr:hypothetical protein [Anaplasma centrale]